ncbi:MAG: hypothetical protein AAF340_08595 [Pseudomonadota bacterium]
MSDRQNLAEHGAGLCVAALAAAGFSAGGPLVPLAVFVAWGVDRFRACGARRQKLAVTNITKALETAGASDRGIGVALELLKERHDKIKITQTDLSDDEKRRNFPNALYDMVFCDAGVPSDDGVEDILRNVLSTAYAELRKDDDFHKIFVQEGLTALERDQENGFARIEGQLGSLDTKMNDMRAMMQDFIAGHDPSAIPFAALKELAAKFGGGDIENRASLEKFLTQKAEEYRSYRDQIDALDDRIAGVHNLKVAAQDAAERLDFDEVEALLERVDMVETEIMAETKEARATNALLRGRAEQAYKIFTAAAESFRELDVLEMAERRDRYQGQLYDHGLRYGGTGMARAIEMQRPGIAALEETAHREHRALFTQNLALTLQNQGTRTEGKAGTDLLAKAVTAYRDALTVRTRADYPVDWAMTTQNLAIALEEQGTRTQGRPGTDLLAKAVTAYRDALTVYTRKDHRVHWAMTTTNLGIALEQQGTRTEGKAGIDLLKEAVAAYRDALTVYTRADHPVHWAMTTQNLAGALQKRGTRTEGKAGTDLLAKAVAAYRDALNVFTHADRPVDWATTTQNLAVALQYQGFRTEGTAGTDLIDESVTAFRDAHKVRTRADQPVDWAMTMENIAIAERARANHAATSDPVPHLQSALEHVDAALEVFDPEHMSYNHAKASGLRAKILAELEALKGG